jgi:hypothetical protein
MKVNGLVDGILAQKIELPLSTQGWKNSYF